MNDVKFMSCIILLRAPILGVLLGEIHHFIVIFDTGKRMLSTFMSIIFSFYLFVSVYALIGEGLYGGVIDLKDPTRIERSAGNELYYQLNFNDAVSGLLTLFCILTSNNWNSTTAMYVEMTGSNGPYYFFALYFILAIFVMLNIVISFVMEIYSITLEDSAPKSAK